MARLTQEKSGRVFTIRRPASRWDAIVFHLPLVLLGGLPLLAAYVIPAKVHQWYTCGFLKITGYPCPFCGYTRAFIAMAHGHWLAAWFECPAGAVVFLLVVALFVWNVAGLLLGLEIKRGAWLCLKPGQGKWLLAGGGLVLLMNWMYRLLWHLK